MERRDVANKSEFGRNIALAQQRMQQSDGNARGLNHVGGALPSESHIHSGSQNGSSGVSHDGGGSQGQDSERAANAEAAVNPGHEQLPQPAAVQENSQFAFRRNTALGWAASAASAFDSAKDIMEALRNKHPNLASELEVKIMTANRNLPHTQTMKSNLEAIPPT